MLRPAAPRAAGVLGILAVAAACASGIVHADEEPTAFEAARAWRHLEELVAFGPRPSGSDANERTRSYIENALAAIELEPVREAFRADTPVGPIEFANVYADLAANAPSESPPLIILCTHFDTKRLPFEFVGANDGGSGTALLLELARTIAQLPDRRVDYRFLFVDGEEALRSFWAGDDNCYGSRHHVAALRQTRELARVKACVLLDMVGDADLELTFEEYSDRTLLELFFDGAERIGLGKHVRGTKRRVKDDHLRFLEAGIPAVDLIDFEYGAANEHWHEPGDTLERCSAASLDVVGRIVLASLGELERFALR